MRPTAPVMTDDYDMGGGSCRGSVRSAKMPPSWGHSPAARQQPPCSNECDYSQRMGDVWERNGAEQAVVVRDKTGGR